MSLQRKIGSADDHLFDGHLDALARLGLAEHAIFTGQERLQLAKTGRLDLPFAPAGDITKRAEQQNAGQTLSLPSSTGAATPTAQPRAGS